MKKLLASLCFICAQALAYSEIPCPTPQSGDVVVIVAGQSNAGSYGDVAYYEPNNDVQFYFGNGKCYPLADALAGFPVPPMPNSGGSIWTRFASIYHAAYPSGGRIIYANIARNGVPIQNWRAPDGQDYPRIQQAVTGLAAKGWTDIRAMLFMGGETDAMAPYGSGALATSALNTMVDGIRANGNSFPVFVGIVSTCRFKTDGTSAGTDFQALSRTEAASRMAKQHEIQSALMKIEAPVKGLYAGANTDLISPSSRWDNCHLNGYGQWLAAQMWFDLLTQKGLLP